MRGLVVLELVIKVSSPNNTASLYSELLVFMIECSHDLKHFSSGGRKHCCAGFDTGHGTGAVLYSCGGILCIRRDHGGAFAHDFDRFLRVASSSFCHET